MRRLALALALVTVEALWLGAWWRWLAGAGVPGLAPLNGALIVAIGLAAVVLAQAVRATSLSPVAVTLVLLVGAGAMMLLGARQAGLSLADLWGGAWVGALIGLILPAVVWWRGTRYGWQTSTPAGARRTVSLALLALGMLGVLAAVGRPLDLVPVVLATAPAALVALALGRLEDASVGFGGTAADFGPTWAGLLCASVGLVVLAAAVLTTLVPFSTAQALTDALWPPPRLIGRAILAVVELIFNVIYGVIFWLVTHLGRVGEPLPPRPKSADAQWQLLDQAGRLVPPWLSTAVRFGIALVVLTVLAVIITRGLSRYLDRRAGGWAAEHESAFSLRRLRDDLGAALGTAWANLRAVVGHWEPRRVGGVRRLYAELLRRMAAQGRGRAPAQTPHEYQPVPERALPTVAAEIEALTEAYERVRYGEDLPDAVTWTRLEATWVRIRSALEARGAGAAPPMPPGRALD